MTVLIANIFSFVGISLLAFSTFSKNKKDMLYMQVGDCLFHSIANTIMGNFAATSTNLICATRNILNANKKNNKIINIIIMILIAAIGLAVNQKGIIGLLPVIASIEYTICSYKLKTAQALRCGLLVNMCLYAIHDGISMLYISMIGRSILIVINVYNIIKHIKTTRENKPNTTS